MEKLIPFDEISYVKEIPQETFREGLASALDGVESPERDKERQAKVIENLPDDLLLHLKGHLHEKYIEKEAFKESYYGKPVEELNEEEGRDYELMVLRGEVFEQLIQNDPEFVTAKTSESVELLSLLQDPDRYGLFEKMGRIRNPDLAYVELNDTGRIVIKGVGEAKLGLLNERAFRQLDSFEDSSKTLKNTVNSLKHAKKMKRMGFDGLAKRKEQMEESGESGPFVDIDDAFKVTLIVPSDRNTKAETLMKQTPVLEKRKEKYLEILSGIEIKKAAFSVREVAELTEHVYNKIEEGNV